MTIKRKVSDPIKYYILVANDTLSSEDDVKIPALQIAKERLLDGRWNLYKATRNREAIRAQDRVLIYLAGKHLHAKHFFAKATVSEVATPGRAARNNEEIWEEKPSKILVLKDVELIGPIHIKDKFSQLSFIPNHNKWGVVLMGGCRNISREDYEAVLRT